MATNYFCRATTTWNGSTWSGSNPWATTAAGGTPSTPSNTSDDVLIANSFTATISGNLTAGTVTNDNRSSATAGGGFVLSDTYTLTSAVQAGSSATPCVTYAGGSPNTAAIVGACTGGSGNGAYAVYLNGSGTLTVTGAISGGSTNDVSGNGARNGGTGILNIVGNCNSQARAASFAGNCIVNASTGTINIAGNLTVLSSAANSVCASNASGGAINVIGNVSGGSVSSCYGMSLSAGTNSVTGSVTGGSGLACVGISCSGGTLTITGNVAAHASAAAGGVSISSSPSVVIVGDITAGSASEGVAIATATATVLLSGNFICAANGYNAIYGMKFRVSPTPIVAKYRFALNGTSTYSDFFTADNSLGQAAIADVRNGTVYASGALTGTAYIPAAGSVALGVPVDATTGTAILTAAAIFDTLTSTLTTAGSIGERLKNVSTVATTGAQLSL